MSFKPSSLKLIQTLANMGNSIIEKTRKTAGNNKMYAVLFSIFESVSLIIKADNTHYPLSLKFIL